MIELSTKNLSHCFIDGAEEHMVLDNINLAVQKGESVAILGASGSGKSTLLCLLTGLIKNLSGEIYYDKQPIQTVTNKAQLLGFMFQRQHFFPELTVKENISLPLHILKKPLQNTETMLSLMKIDRVLWDRYPHQLSGGEQSRVGLARALVHHPKILVADEPTAAMDNELTQAIFKDIVSLQEKLGFSMIVATHDHALLHYFTQIYYLKNGRLEEYKDGRVKR